MYDALALDRNVLSRSSWLGVLRNGFDEGAESLTEPEPNVVNTPHAPAPPVNGMGVLLTRDDTSSSPTVVPVSQTRGMLRGSVNSRDRVWSWCVRTADRPAL